MPNTKINKILSKITIIDEKFKTSDLLFIIENIEKIIF